MHFLFDWTLQLLAMICSDTPNISKYIYAEAIDSDTCMYMSADAITYVQRYAI